MGETFLIHINCSKILADSDETQYTMFIDSTKMSIVYELVEWIRWMFSLESCFYITHDNFVIHELEDIQLLSKLKNFEVKPCGRSHCAHKKMYRTLLKNLNLFVSWNGVEVHKYFLHKLNQVDQKLTWENNKISPMIYASGNKGHLSFIEDKNTNTNFTNRITPESGNLFICDDKVPPPLKNNSTPLTKRISADKMKQGLNVESPTEPNYSLNKKILNENFLVNSECKLKHLDGSSSALTENLTPETTGPDLINNTSVNSVNNTLKNAQEHCKNSQKSYSKKYVKPFSLGEILSNIREDFEKQNMEMKQKKNSASPNFINMEEGNLDENLTNGINYFTPDCKINEGRKRQRTRKRKKSKKENIEKEEITSPYLDTNITATLDIHKTNKIKPSHIRFDIENDENLMETETFEDEQSLQNENKFEEKSKQMNNSPSLIFPKTNPEGFVAVTMDGNQEISGLYQTCSVTNNTENKMEYSFGADGSIAQDKIIHLNNSVPDNTNQPFDLTENSESNKCKPELCSLLSFKEKFKNAVVIERFY